MISIRVLPMNPGHDDTAHAQTRWLSTCTLVQDVLMALVLVSYRAVRHIYILFRYIYLFIYLFWCVGVCVLLASGQCHYYLSARFSVFPN